MVLILLMKVLIDTNVIIRWLEDPKLIAKVPRSIIENIANEVFYSVACLWEIGIKKKTGKLSIEDNYEFLIEEQSFQHLDINKNHVRRVSELELHHRDPFDRIIIAQAISENLSIVTSDTTFEKYPVNIIKA